MLNKVAIILFSSILKYPGTPWEIMKEAIDVGADCIVLDKVFVLSDPAGYRISLYSVLF